jgi:hypothetical protein
VQDRARLARGSDQAGFGGVFILPVASSSASQIPTVSFNECENLPDFHAATLPAVHGGYKDVQQFRELTTQRPGPRRRSIATWTRWPGSLQRLGASSWELDVLAMTNLNRLERESFEERDKPAPKSLRKIFTFRCDK